MFFHSFSICPPHLFIHFLIFNKCPQYANYMNSPDFFFLQFNKMTKNVQANQKGPMKQTAILTTVLQPPVSSSRLCFALSLTGIVWGLQLAALIAFCDLTLRSVSNRPLCMHFSLLFLLPLLNL